MALVPFWTDYLNTVDQPILRRGYLDDADGSFSHWDAPVGGVAYEQNETAYMSHYAGVRLPGADQLIPSGDGVPATDFVSCTVAMGNIAGLSGSTHLTTEVWCRLHKYPTAAGRGYVLVSKGNDTVYTNHVWFLTVDQDGAVHFSDGQGEGVTANGTLALHATYHLALVFDGTQATSVNRAKLYVNGTFTAWSTTPTTPFLTAVGTTGRPFSIGASDVPDLHFAGTLSDVAIYLTANLTTTQITDHAAGGSTYANRVLADGANWYWRLSELGVGTLPTGYMAATLELSATISTGPIMRCNADLDVVYVALHNASSKRSKLMACKNALDVIEVFDFTSSGAKPSCITDAEVDAGNGAYFTMGYRVAVDTRDVSGGFTILDIGLYSGSGDRGGHIVSANVNAGGTGYQVGDRLAVSGGGETGGVLEVTGVSAGAITTLSIPDTGYLHITSTGTALLGGSGTGATVNITASALVDFTRLNSGIPPTYEFMGPTGDSYPPNREITAMPGDPGWSGAMTEWAGVHGVRINELTGELWTFTSDVLAPGGPLNENDNKSYLNFHWSVDNGSSFTSLAATVRQIETQKQWHELYGLPADNVAAIVGKWHQLSTFEMQLLVPGGSYTSATGSAGTGGYFSLPAYPDEEGIWPSARSPGDNDGWRASGVEVPDYTLGAWGGTNASAQFKGNSFHRILPWVLVVSADLRLGILDPDPAALTIAWSTPTASPGGGPWRGVAFVVEAAATGGGPRSWGYILG